MKIEDGSNPSGDLVRQHIREMLLKLKALKDGERSAEGQRKKTTGTTDRDEPRE